LASFMWLSLRKAALVGTSSAAWQEIRVRSGRDDKGGSGAFSEEWLVAKWYRRSLHFAPTARRGRRDDKGDNGAFSEEWLVAEGAG
jgi:hypothetical protein